MPAKPFVLIENGIGEIELPDGIRWFDVAGQKLWPVYDGSMITTKSYSCLLREQDDKVYGSGMEFTLADTLETAKTKVAEALCRFEQINPDGGELPKAPK